VSLRTKILLVLSVVIGAYIGFNYAIQRALVFPGFDALQSSLADTNLARLEGAFDTVVESVNAMCTDTAHWDATYAFMQGKNPEYPEENFPKSFFLEAQFNLIMLIDPAGNVRFSRAYDDESGRFISIDELFPVPFAPDDPLIHHRGLQSNVRGLIATPHSLVAISSNTILTSESRGPIAGTMLLGRFLDRDDLDAIRDKMEAQFAVLPLKAAQDELGESESRALAEAPEAVAHRAVGHTLRSYKLIRNVYGHPIGLLRAEMPRAITAVGLSAVQLAVWLLVIAGILFLAAIWVLLQRLILAPVSSLTSHISQLRESGNLSRRLNLTRDDELGTLATQFDALTTELEQARQEMAESRDAALEVARMKSDFLATMSHEIRTPMNGVVGMVDLLMGTELTEKQRRFTETIQHSADGLLVIINDILDLSKLESGRIELEQCDFGVRSLVEEVALLFAAAAHAKGLELVCSIPPDLDAVCKGDPNRLRQILINLLGNAIKFTSRGEVVLEVSVSPESSDMYRARFEVRDTGIGIPKELRARVFDSFAQVDASTTRKFGGTGLGLSICHRLVALMGGEIGVEGGPGQGSAFWFELPLARSGMTGSVWRLAPTSLGGIRVLVAHDNQTSRALLERQLASWQMPCVSVGDAEAALVALRQAAADGGPCEIALLDMDLPDIGGSELARAIRRDPAIGDIALVMLCSITSGDPIDELDVQGSLTKPVLRSALFDCLSTVLGQAETHAPAQAAAARPDAAESNSLHGQRVLLVEDNLVNQTVVIAMLESMGCHIEAVSNGQEAVSASAARHYDVVLMDCQMPVMDGFEASCEIRRREAEEGAAAHVPILALTANAIEGDRGRCLAAGMDDYLCKPFRQQQLRALLERWCAAATPAVPSEPARAPAPQLPLPDATASQRIDPAALEEIRALENPERRRLATDQIRSYLERSEELVDELRVALEAADESGALETLHALRCSSENVGAREVSACCEAFAARVRAGDQVASKALLGELEGTCEAARAALERLLD
jgi:signal transduction histidine kinase/CheY-like chemotaxis protein